ncbi:MAG: hypothetical protein FWC27_00055 [Firmicutes bacterium]|nr:hypothetical protein [Bacillota bacterium]
MVFLLPILAPFLFPLSVGSNILELLTGNAALEGCWWEQFVGFWQLVWNSMVNWL